MFSHFAAGQTQYGAAAFSLIPLTQSVSLELGLGARAAPVTTSAHGTVSAFLLVADWGLHWTWLRRPSFELNVQLNAQLSDIGYRARATGSATAKDARGFAGLGRVGFGAQFSVTRRLRSVSTLGAGYPFLAYTVSDGGRTISGASGLELDASSGFLWMF